MKTFLSSLAAILVVASVVMLGCVPAVTNVKPSPEVTQAPDAAAPPPRTELPPSPLPMPTSEAGQSQAPSPTYRPASATAKDAGPVLAADLRNKEEVNASAMQFAREVPNVKYVKTCYSKLYGGWYLLLYIEKAKNISLQQYSWNPKAREWEIIYQLKELPSKQVEFHLKGEVGDEKCFVLKK